MDAHTLAVNIVLGPEASRRVSATLQALRGAGLREETLLRSLGVISGEVAADRLDALRKVPGVVVLMDETARVPPREPSAS